MNSYLVIKRSPQKQVMARSQGYWEKFGTVNYLSAQPFMCVVKQLVQTNRQPPAGASLPLPVPPPFQHTQTHLNPHPHNQ